MNLPINTFKHAIREGRQQIGLWRMMPGPYGVEVLAGSGFDWIALDTEHAPANSIGILAELQALAPYPVAPVVRPAANDPVLIKRLLDVGAQTLLIPYVQSAEEARAAVAALRYPPRGIRGVAGMMRASRFGRVVDYTTRADEELCLLVQIETHSALNDLDAIAAVDGVDGLFIGPADLAASLGHPGQLNHPEVVAAIEDILSRSRAAGKPAGLLTFDPDFAERCMALGSVFTAVGSDLAILRDGAEGLARSCRQRIPS